MQHLSLIEIAMDSIEEQALDAQRSAGSLWSPEAIAMSIIALEAHDPKNDNASSKLRRLLTERQTDNGSVVMDASIPETYWPTAWAVLAWSQSLEFREHRRKAVRFLEQASGDHFAQPPGDSLGHDTKLKGWPWIGGTHSWIQPTSAAIMALDSQQMQYHDRVTEAVGMILDRQLPDGGWNYGNRKVFRHYLRPLPEDTGYALVALRQHVEIQQVAASISYLQKCVTTLKAPAALAWSLLGLTAWECRPPEAEQFVHRSLEQQQTVGPYPLRYLAQLAIAYYSKDELVAPLSRNRRRQ